MSHCALGKGDQGPCQQLDLFEVAFENLAHGFDNCMRRASFLLDFAQPPFYLVKYVIEIDPNRFEFTCPIGEHGFDLFGHSGKRLLGRAAFRHGIKVHDDAFASMRKLDIFHALAERLETVVLGSVQEFAPTILADACPMVLRLVGDT